MERKKKFFFTAIFILLVFILLEGTARFVLRFDSLQAKILAGDDYCKKVEYVFKHPSAKEGANHAFERFDSVKGWELIPGKRIWNYHVNHKLTIDSTGNRIHHINNRPIQPSIRVATIGDSFTFGEEVDDDSTYPAMLEKMIPGAEVINLGVPGYGIDQMLLKFKEQLPVLKADLIILSFIHDDLSRCFTDFSFYMKPFFTCSNDEWKLEKIKMSPEQFYNEYHFHSKFVMLSALAFHKLFFFDNPQNKITAKEEKEMLRFLLNEFKAASASIGADLLVTVIPDPGQVKDTSIIHIFRNTAALTQSICSELEIDFFYQESCFNEALEKGLNTSGMHWKADGNEVIAKCITERH